ncbi:hypothetical protein [Pseudomonas donghuensis]|uniref:hypothetical protein n=1 Tax=Pseudomonas donghuensis TaxID=1163398 RepID=UPI00029AAB54|nr:hypothetical protein [Pseudomonas donghuensis]
MDFIVVTHSFRKGFDAQKFRGQLPTHLQTFPRGCCGVVSELLGDYLNTQLGLRVEYVCGERDGGSHAWLELDDVVIDITSDQFDGRPPVFIAVKDDWYASWEESARHIAIHHPSAWTYSEERNILRAVLSEAGLPKLTT